MARNAVIVRAGRASLHAQWRGGAADGFDLIVAAYEELPTNLLDAATENMLIPGAKVEGWAALFRQRPDLLRRYDAIALLDDDLRCGPRDIALSFAAGRRHGLALWQPSLTWDSYFSYAITLNNPLFELRYVNFVEMMCPFFSIDHLERSLPLFELGLETGIDRLWCRLRESAHKAYAILDCVKLTHTRPVGANKTAQGFADARNGYQRVINQMEADMRLPFRGPVAYAGLTPAGRPIEGRTQMAARCLAPLLGWRQSVNQRWFWKPFADHARHIMLRPIDNEFVDVRRLGRI